MEEWAHRGRVFEVNSMYLLPDDAWAYELTLSRGRSGSSSGLIVLVADATAHEGPFTPMSSVHARVVAEEVELPWPILRRFVELVDTSGDIVADEHDGAVSGDLSASRNTWQFADRSFEVNSFDFAQHDCWCYELCELTPPGTDNDYIEVRIPDLQPVRDPFQPAPADEARFVAHGSLAIPWVVFRHFIDKVENDGPIA